MQILMTVIVGLIFFRLAYRFLAASLKLSLFLILVVAGQAYFGPENGLVGLENLKISETIDGLAAKVESFDSTFISYAKETIKEEFKLTKL